MTIRINAAVLRQHVSSIFNACGVADDDAVRIADCLVSADELGLQSHGVMLVEMYVNRLRAGSISASASPEILSDQGAAIVLDGHHTFGVVAADFAMTTAIARAKKLGAGIVAVRHGFHFGMARRFAVTAAGEDCIGIAMCNTRPLMPAPGGAERVVGNNPLAIAVPTDDPVPLVLDMAMSEAAMGKIRMAARNGQDIPQNWAVREDGSATTDPGEAISGMLLPTAGPKGFGLALMIDMMTGLLSGGAMGSEVKALYDNDAEPYNCSHLLMAINVEHFGNVASVRRRALRMVENIRHGRRAPGIDRLFAPGEPEYDHARTSKRTVEIGEKILEMLNALSVRFGLNEIDTRPQ